MDKMSQFTRSSPRGFCVQILTLEKVIETVILVVTDYDDLHLITLEIWTLLLYTYLYGSI